jgi:hypothetical protein
MCLTLVWVPSYGGSWDFPSLWEIRLESSPGGRLASSIETFIARIDFIFLSGFFYDGLDQRSIQ